jgi:hypothetical protein
MIIAAVRARTMSLISAFSRVDQAKPGKAASLGIHIADVRHSRLADCPVAIVNDYFGACDAGVP